MARIGAAVASGPFFEPSFTDEIFEKIEAAPRAFEGSREIRLSAELRLRIIAAVEGYVRARAAFVDAATWKDLRALIEPVSKGSKDLTSALEALTASHGKDGNAQLAMYCAENLISAHCGPGGLNVAELCVKLYRLRIATRRALDACDRDTRRGRESDDALLVCIDELRAVYKAAGGLSIEPKTVSVDRSEDVFETKLSGFVLFLHECLNILPAEIYPYSDAHPNDRIGLAKQVERFFKPEKTRKGRRTIAGAIADAQPSLAG